MLGEYIHTKTAIGGQALKMLTAIRYLFIIRHLHYIFLGYFLHNEKKSEVEELSFEELEIGQRAKKERGA